MSIRKSKECRHIAPLLENAAHGKGEQKENAKVHAHITECANCRAEYNQWVQTANLIETWRTAEVPKSHRDWNDLHARLTTAQQAPKRRPVFALRLGMGGLAGATAIAAFCLLFSHPTEEGDRGAGGQVEKSVAVQSQPVTKTPDMENLKPILHSEVLASKKFAGISGTKTYLPQRRSSFGRGTTPFGTVKRAVRTSTPVLVQYRESLAAAPVKRKITPKWRDNSKILAQHKSELKPEGSRRVLLNVDGEVSPPEQTHEYALGAVPSGHIAGIQLTPASYSSSEKTAW